MGFALVGRWLQEYLCPLQMAEEISKPLSEAQKVTMVSSGGSEVGAAKLAGEVLDIMTKLPAAVEKLTGIDISLVNQAICTQDNSEKPPAGVGPNSHVSCSPPGCRNTDPCALRRAEAARILWQISTLSCAYNHCNSSWTLHCDVSVHACIPWLFLSVAIVGLYSSPF